jgi:hypothetical protein
VDGFVDGWHDWLSVFDSFQIEFGEQTEAGDELVAMARMTAVPKGTAATIEGAAKGGVYIRWKQGAADGVPLGTRDRVSGRRATGIGSSLPGARGGLFSPAGIESFFLDVGVSNPDAEVDPAAAASAAKHGWEFIREQSEVG